VYSCSKCTVLLTLCGKSVSVKANGAFRDEAPRSSLHPKRNAGSQYMCKSYATCVCKESSAVTAGTVTKLRNGICLRGLRVFGNRLMRKVFGPRRDEVTGEWGRSLNADGIIRTYRPVSLGLSFREGELGGARARMRGEET
jgi:hypothetical protein